MNRHIFKVGLLAIFTMLISIGSAQAQNLGADEIEKYSADTEKLVSFLEFTFNTIGNPEVPVKEKDIIINQSFAKFFENEKVQIEDDLDENREVPINKDVQAYLKDIDFFFKHVAFKFDIEQIEHQINEKNQLFFKVTINRNLKGITVAGDTIDSNRLRYIEINLNDTEKDLKIASIYTTKLNEKEELRNWWNELPLVWKEVLGKNRMLYDTIRMSDLLWFNDSLAKLNIEVSWKLSRDTLTIASHDSLYLALNDSAAINAAFIDRQLKNITKLDTINISGMPQITSLEPLAKLSELKRIDCSHTPIRELMPLRNLTHLEFLDCAHTDITKLDALKYSTRMETLHIDGNQIQNIAPVANFVQLQKLFLNQTLVDSLEPISELGLLKELEFAGTPVKSLQALSDLKQLEHLDFSKTNISDLSPLASMTNLYILKFEGSAVSDLQPLAGAETLHYLFADQTRISDLSPLDGLSTLSKIYCDKTQINRKDAIAFMESNPNVLVVYESTNLADWWRGLTPAWQQVFAPYVRSMQNPSKEELHQITKMESLDISGNKQIRSLEALTNFARLKVLNCQQTDIIDIEAVASLTDLNELNFSDTRVSNLQPLESLNRMRKISFDRTQVASIAPLIELSNLEYIYCDESPVPVAEVLTFMQAHPDCLVIYQTATLEQWWAGLPEVWKLLDEGFSISGDALSREQLQQIVNRKSVDLNSLDEMQERAIEIRSLEYLQQFLLLKELKFSNTSITNLVPLQGMESLRVIIAPNNPIESLEPLSEVKNLEILDVQNSPIESLEFLDGLQQLKKINCSGTQIKKLKGIENKQQLQQVDCYNTSIRKLKELEYLPALKLVRCYNTRLKQRTIDKFKEARPEVEVIYY